MDPIDPKSAAMLIQDLQNDVIIEGGAFADSGSPAHAKKQNVPTAVAGGSLHIPSSFDGSGAAGSGGGA